VDLDKFITETLSDIKTGIHEANVRAKGENPKPDAPNYFFLRPGSKQEIGAGIEFDVAVTTKSEGKGKAGAKVTLAVVEADFGGSGSIAKENVSRIRFTVTVGNWIG
jgi:hypothetical protein